MSDAAYPTEWLRKAQIDVRAARRLLAEPAEVEAAAYHIQQAAEKVLKALLTQLGVRYPRGGRGGHDLDRLASLLPNDHVLRARAYALVDLTPWATSFRYPWDDPATAPDPPSGEDLAQRLGEVETFISSVARSFHATE